MEEAVKNKNAFAASEVSSGGFLGDDKRSVEEIIRDDANELREAGSTKFEAAETLKKIHQQARDSFGSEAVCGPNLVATHYDSRGSLPCPFGDGFYEKGETVAKDATNGRVFFLSSLSIHLIQVHGFFQGRGSRYRIEPADAIRLARHSGQ